MSMSRAYHQPRRVEIRNGGREPSPHFFDQAAIGEPLITRNEQGLSQSPVVAGPLQGERGDAEWVPNPLRHPLVVLTIELAGPRRGDVGRCPAGAQS